MVFDILISVYILSGVFIFFFGLKSNVKLIPLIFRYIGWGIFGYGTYMDKDICFFIGLFILMLMDVLNKRKEIKQMISTLIPYITFGLFALRTVSGVFAFIAIGTAIVYLVVQNKVSN